MKNEKEYSSKPFCAGLLVLACIFSVFYAKFVYYADTPLHTVVSQTLLFQDVESDLSGLFPHIYAYPLYHFVQKMIHLLLQVDYNTAAALLLPLTIICSVFLYRKMIMMIVKEDVKGNKYFADFVSLGAVVFNVARCGLNNWRYYGLQCGANPFHNPTILFVRPFAIASFIYFIKCIETYQQKNNYKYAVLFGLFTLLSVGAKPSYAIVFLPAMGIYTLYFMIRNKSIKFGIVALAAVLPSLILLIIQQSWVPTQIEALDQTYQMTIRFGGSFQLEGMEVITASLVTFPVAILLFRGSLMKREPVYFIAIVALIIGWLQMFLIAFGAGDTSWGYDLSVQFATIISLAEAKHYKEAKTYRKVINIAAYGVFAYQVWAGLQYLQKMYVTTQFWF